MLELGRLPHPMFGSNQSSSDIELGGAVRLGPGMKAGFGKTVFR